MASRADINLNEALAYISNEFSNVDYGITGKEGRVYVTTNERALDAILKSVQKNPIHLGISGLHNFSIMSQRGSKGAILFDYSSSVFNFFYEVKKALKNSSSGKEFISNLVENLKDPDSKVVLADDIDKIEENLNKELKDGKSWLYDKDNIRFQMIKKLFEQDKIIQITLDLRDGGHFNIIKDWFKKYTEFQLDSIYLSNALEWVEYESGKKIYEAARKSIFDLAQKSTVIIDAAEKIQRLFNSRDLFCSF